MRSSPNRRRAHRGDANAAAFFDLVDAFAGIGLADDCGERREFTEIETLALPGRADEHVANELRADGRRADRLHAEFLIHLAARRIVDARDDAFDLEHALGDERRHDVAVVAVGDCDKTIGGRRAGAFEDVVVDTGSDDDVAFEFLPEAFECGGIFIDDDDFVTVGIQEFCERRADASATNDEISHA